MNTDLILNKTETIQKCLKRIEMKYKEKSNVTFEKNIDAQDIIVLNLQRACEAAIDLALYLIRIKQLGLPQTSKDAFSLLEKNKIITEPLANRLQAMVGFRNIAVHDYTQLNIEIMKKIVETHLQDFRDYIELIKQHCFLAS